MSPGDPAPRQSIAQSKSAEELAEILGSYDQRAKEQRQHEYLNELIHSGRIKTDGAPINHHEEGRQ